MSAEQGNGEPAAADGGLLVLRPSMPGDDLDAIAPALTGAFAAARAALGEGRPVAIVLRSADLEGQGTPADAAVATGLLGMVRTLAIEGAKPGWRVNVVAHGEGDDEAIEGTLRLLADAPLSGRLLETGVGNLGKVVP